MVPVGPAVVAIGVFDGVHLGHRALLKSAHDHARRTATLAMTLTFDRDPDELAHPEAAAPHLMDNETRLAALADIGIDVLLIVPFTPVVLTMSPDTFLNSVVASAADIRAIHVGEDFRFGTHAQGDLDDLYVWAAERGVDVFAHPLVHVEGTPVTSSRIRALVAAGDVARAATLLDRPHSVKGTVHSGQGRGRALGFPTANLTPFPGAALPADGVYAGHVVTPDGGIWPSAVSVGRPPTFTDALDYFEAHLIGFEGNLDNCVLSVRFLERLRDQRAFSSVWALREAIAADVARAASIAGLRVSPDSAYLDNEGVPFVEDPLALEAAERAVAMMPNVNDASYAQYNDTWVVVFGPIRLSSLFRDGGLSEALVTGRLSSVGLPFVWDPFPPSSAQSARPELNWLRVFTLLVPPDRADEARDLLSAFRG